MHYPITPAVPAIKKNGNCKDYKARFEHRIFHHHAGSYLTGNQS
jgi:hypothetical protein